LVVVVDGDDILIAPPTAAREVAKLSAAKPR